FKILSFLFVFLSVPDEKEKFEPTVFRDTIVQGLNEAGSDLEAIAKFLDSAGSRLDYRRYADTLFDILVAGSMLAPGGTRIDDNDKTKMTRHCVFFAEEDHDAIRNYAQVRMRKGWLIAVFRL
ncbi:hypothetical protein CIB84_013676, partial [Bambusicola thoracicus]